MLVLYVPAAAFAKCASILLDTDVATGNAPSRWNITTCACLMSAIVEIPIMSHKSADRSQRPEGQSPVYTLHRD